LEINQGYTTVNQTPKISNLVMLHTNEDTYEDGTDSVPKRRHIKFRRREISQKKAYNKYKNTVSELLTLHNNTLMPLVDHASIY
jgi:hypothetical protein